MKLFAIILAATLLSACSSATLKKPFLWEADKDSQKIYVFAYDMTGFTDEEFPKRAHEALKESSHMLMLNGRSLADAKDKESAIMPSKVADIKNLISKETWERLRDRTPDISDESANRSNPNLVMQYYAEINGNQHMRMSQFDYKYLQDKYWSYDVMERVAKADGKKIRYAGHGKPNSCVYQGHIDQLETIVKEDIPLPKMAMRKK